MINSAMRMPTYLREEPLILQMMNYMCMSMAITFKVKITGRFICPCLVFPV